MGNKRSIPSIDVDVDRQENDTPLPVVNVLYNDWYLSIYLSIYLTSLSISLCIVNLLIGVYYLYVLRTLVDTKVLSI
jgi:hypothetical protein